MAAAGAALGVFAARYAFTRPRGFTVYYETTWENALNGRQTSYEHWLSVRPDGSFSVSRAGKQAGGKKIPTIVIVDLNAKTETQSVPDMPDAKIVLPLTEREVARFRQTGGPAPVTAASGCTQYPTGMPAEGYVGTDTYQGLKVAKYLLKGNGPAGVQRVSYLAPDLNCAPVYDRLELPDGVVTVRAVRVLRQHEERLFETPWPRRVQPKEVAAIVKSECASRYYQQLQAKLERRMAERETEAKP